MSVKVVRRGFTGAVFTLAILLLLACSQLVFPASAYASDKVYDSYYDRTLPQNGKYTYRFYALNAAQTTLYNKPFSEQVLYFNHDIPLYLKTDNPDSSSFEVYSFQSCFMTLLTADTSEFNDIDFKKDSKGSLCKVDGGYIFTVSASEPGTYSFVVVEKKSDGSSVIADRFDLTLQDYDKAQNAWVDSVISKATKTSMDSFEKMDAVVSYLNTNYDFKYLTFDPDEYRAIYHASEPNYPFFKTQRWDSLISPTKLKLFAERIGGFSSVERLYDKYAGGTSEWYQWHSYINCVKGSKYKYYGVCPPSSTGKVDVSKKIDFTNPKSLYKLNGIKAFMYSYDLASESGSSSSSVNNSSKWIKSSKGWQYKYSNGTYATGMKKIDSKYYYFDKNGWMKTGWQKISNKWYYFKSDGARVSGWQKISKKWYYFNSSGVRMTGWQKLSGKWYYLDPSSGVMKTGKQTISKKTYFFNSSGVMQTGWIKNSNKWYYGTSSGLLKTGWLKTGGKWYYFSSAGVMQTGFKTIGKAKYYFNSSGAMQTGWKKIAGKYYFFNSSGAMQKSKWIGNYYVKSNGQMATNTWIGKYYVDKNGKWVPGKKKAT